MHVDAMQAMQFSAGPERFVPRAFGNAPGPSVVRRTGEASEPVVPRVVSNALQPFEPRPVGSALQKAGRASVPQHEVDAQVRLSVCTDAPHNCPLLLSLENLTVSMSSASHVDQQACNSLFETDICMHAIMILDCSQG